MLRGSNDSYPYYRKKIGSLSVNAMTVPPSPPAVFAHQSTSLTESGALEQTEPGKKRLVQIALSGAISVLHFHQQLRLGHSSLNGSAGRAPYSPEERRTLLLQAQTLLPCALFTHALGTDTNEFEQLILDRNLEASDPSTLFASSLSEKDIWHSGTVYTPLPLATHIITQLFSLSPPNSTLLAGRIVDPACGCGVFLHAVIETLAREGYSAKKLTRLLVENLVGIDTNADALLVAEFSLLFAMRRAFPSLAAKDLPSLLGTSLICDNFLIPSAALTSRGLTSPESIGYFVGNPPFGLRRDGRIEATEAHTHKERHGGKVRGNISSYLFFLSAGFVSLRREGSLALITPNAWLGIKSAQPLREYLLTSEALCRIEENPAQIFADRGVETITTYLTKETRSSRITLARVSHPEIVAEDYGSISAKGCRRRPGHTIPLRWSDTLDELFATIATNSRAIGKRPSLFLPLIALQEYAVGHGEPPQTKEHSQRRLFHDEEPGDSSWVPFLRGKDIDRYAITWSGTYLSYGPWLAQPGTREHYEIPRVIIREITGKRPRLIRACATDASLFYNRSLLHILVTAAPSSPAQPTTTDLALALSGLLNSTIINAFFFFHGRKVQRALFPKILCDDLKNIPIPVGFESGATELARIVSEKNGEERDKAVDAIVGEMFNFSAAEQRQLAAHLCSTAL